MVRHLSAQGSVFGSLCPLKLFPPITLSSRKTPFKSSTLIDNKHCMYRACGLKPRFPVYLHREAFSRSYDDGRTLSQASPGRPDSPSNQASVDGVFEPDDFDHLITNVCERKKYGIVLREKFIIYIYKRKKNEVNGWCIQIDISLKKYVIWRKLPGRFSHFVTSF